MAGISNCNKSLVEFCCAGTGNFLMVYLVLAVSMQLVVCNTTANEDVFKHSVGALIQNIVLFSAPKVADCNSNFIRTRAVDVPREYKLCEIHKVQSLCVAVGGCRARFIQPNISNILLLSLSLSLLCFLCINKYITVFIYNSIYIERQTCPPMLRLPSCSSVVKQFPPYTYRQKKYIERERI